MRVSRRAQVARWGGAVLLVLAPLPWLGVGTAAADGAALVAPGNNGTLKVHEQGTPSGFEDNDPKVCIFNFEGFSFDEGQTGYITIDGQGQTSGSYGPIDFGPTDASGFYATSYVNDGGLTVPDGHYKATLYGKDGPQGVQDEVKAKSKVFKVICDQPQPTDTETTPDVTNTETTPDVTNTETTPDVTNTETTPTFTETETTEEATPSHTKTIETESSQPGERSPSVKATRLTQPASLPKTGSELPIGAALAASLLLIGLGALLILGPGRLATERHYRKH